MSFSNYISEGISLLAVVVSLLATIYSRKANEHSISANRISVQTLEEQRKVRIWELLRVLEIQLIEMADSRGKFQQLSFEIEKFIETLPPRFKEIQLLNELKDKLTFLEDIEQIYDSQSKQLRELTYSCWKLGQYDTELEQTINQLISATEKYCALILTRFSKSRDIFDKLQNYSDCE